MVGLWEKRTGQTLLYTGDVGNTRLPWRDHALWWQRTGAPWPLSLYYDDTYESVVSDTLPTLEETRQRVEQVLQLFPPLLLHWSQLGLEQVWPLGIDRPFEWSPDAFPEWQRKLARAGLAPAGIRLVRLHTLEAPPRGQRQWVLILTGHTTACPSTSVEKRPPPLRTGLIRVPFCLHPDRTTLSALFDAFHPVDAAPLGFAVDPNTCK